MDSDVIFQINPLIDKEQRWHGSNRHQLRKGRPRLMPLLLVLISADRTVAAGQTLTQHGAAQPPSSGT